MCDHVRISAWFAGVSLLIKESESIRRTHTHTEGLVTRAYIYKICMTARSAVWKVANPDFKPVSTVFTGH